MAWTMGRLGSNISWLDRQALSTKRLGEEMAKTDIVLESADAYDDLVLLLGLNNGQVADVKKVLAYKVSLFYHRWTAKPEKEMPECVKNALTAVRNAANENESVRSMLAHDPKQGPPDA